MNRTTIAIAALLLSVATHATSATLAFSNAWARATPPNASVAGAFLDIRNDGTKADRLLSASSEISASVEIHEMKTVDGIMRMREVTGGLAIPAGKSLTLKPGSYHLMLISPERPLAEGQQITINLVFENAGTHAVAFKVLKAPPAGAGQGHMQH